MQSTHRRGVLLRDGAARAEAIRLEVDVENGGGDGRADGKRRARYAGIDATG